MNRVCLTILVVFSYFAMADLKPQRKWVPAAVQNFELTGSASTGGKDTPVKSGTVQMQGDEILGSTVTFATEKETKFVLKEASPMAQPSGGNNYDLTGELTFNDKTETVHFPAQITNSDHVISATIQATMAGKTPVTIHVSGSKASKYRPWSNSSD